MFTIDPSNVTILDPTGDLFVVSGRVPFDDEDTTIVVQAKDLDQAQSHLDSVLYENEDNGDQARAKNERDNGSAVYFTFSSCIAKLSV